MEIFAEFIAEYGTQILFTIFTAITGALGIVVKNIYKKVADDKVKKSVVETCVKAVEQLYAELAGEEKFYKAVEAASEMLEQKGIPITELELQMLIEAAVNEFKKQVKE